MPGQMGARTGQEGFRHMTSAVMSDLLKHTGDAAQAGQTLMEKALSAVRTMVAPSGGRPEPTMLEHHQHETHGLAWLKVYVEALNEMHNWATRLDEEGKFGETEQLLLQAAFGEYLSQILGGFPMSQGEIVRLHHLGLSQEDVDAFSIPSVIDLAVNGFTRDVKTRLAQLMVERQGDSTFGDAGLDETDEMIREQFRRYTEERILPDAHEWHLKDQLIPMEIIQEMAELGVFGLTIPEAYGGLGMHKIAMCVVSEELSRGYIGTGSLGTRSEIAAELILIGGTEAQKNHWLPKIASAEILPTAVFTEPNTGSDLGSLRTRAVKEGNSAYMVTGNKTWITHGARADVMTMLARTDPGENGYRGLSMFLAEKPRGDDDHMFPVDGMTGGEIEVLGYRGMKEYEIAFDNFQVKAENLLGGQEGQGFKHLMATFESARIQTAARAVGVAQNAMEIALQYALDRQQFGKPLISFPRVANKLVVMAVEIMVARQLTYYSAREKDEGRRCDLEAGLAKLLGARVAWAAADNAVQVHGGNGFALEYPISRVLCDARILNIFEGAAEIQAQVIARRLLEDA